MCLCNAVPLGCSMEFLKNNKTMETLRQFNDSCYHKTADVCKGDESVTVTFIARLNPVCENRLISLA
jgi:hypothetical protein